MITNPNTNPNPKASDLWDRYGLELSVLRTMWVAPLVSGIAAVAATLVATGSVMIAATAGVTLALAVVVMLAALALSGWSVGVIEARQTLNPLTIKHKR